MIRQHRGLASLWKYPNARFFSTNSGESDSGHNGDIDVDKLVNFFKKADETVVHSPKEDVSFGTEETTGNTAPTKHSSPRPTVILQEKRDDDKTLRQSNAHRHVPWTSNRFQKEFHITKVSPNSKEHGTSFAKMFRESSFTQIGDFKHREVIGVVVETANDSDLYIDFGGKLLAVVSQPEGSFYPRGSLVRIRLHDPEMANRFMINTRSISLLEADATLLGAYRGQVVNQSQELVGQGYLPPTSDFADSSHVKMNKSVVSLDHWKLD